MKFSVYHNNQYKELRFEDGSLNYSTGLLDENEALEMAKGLISIVEDLLPAQYEKQENLLYEIREDL